MDDFLLHSPSIIDLHLENITPSNTLAITALPKLNKITACGIILERLIQARPVEIVAYPGVCPGGLSVHQHLRASSFTTVVNLILAVETHLLAIANIIAEFIPHLRRLDLTLEIWEYNSFCDHLALADRGNKLVALAPYLISYGSPCCDICHWPGHIPDITPLTCHLQLEQLRVEYRWNKPPCSPKIYPEAWLTFAVLPRCPLLKEAEVIVTARKERGGAFLPWQHYQCSQDASASGTGWITSELERAYRL